MTTTPNETWPERDLEHLAACPACGGERNEVALGGLEDTTFRAAPGRWSVKRCLDCAVCYLDPRPTQGSMERAYRRYFTHSAGTRVGSPISFVRTAIGNSYRNRIFGTRLRPSMPLGAWIAKWVGGATLQRIRHEDRGLSAHFKVPGKLLDVGCGGGDFLVFARELGWQASGLEPDPRASEAAAKRGVDILGATLSELHGYDGHFDAITMSHVIEHLHDPQEALTTCFRLLRPGGMLLVETPNISSLGFEIYGRHWRGLEAPRHLVIFSIEALSGCLSRAGFELTVEPAPARAGDAIARASALMRAGHDPYASVQCLTVPEQIQLAGVIAQMRSAASRAPERGEVMRLVARRPFRPEGGRHREHGGPAARDPRLHATRQPSQA